MYSMERVPRRTSPNLENSKVERMVAVVEALETLLNPVERVRKCHYLQKFAGDVAKADIQKDSHVKQWKQCAGIVPSKDTLRKFA